MRTATVAVTRPDLALVLGGAECVWDDVEDLEALIGRPWPGVIIAANDIGVHWPRALHHWASVHADRFHGADGWVAQRAAAGHPDGFVTWGPDNLRRRRIADRYVRQWVSGSSGLLAMIVALDALGCHRVALCGVPMDDRPHFRESRVHVPGKPWGAARTHRRAIERVLDRLRGRVRSMSGWTRDVLGEPSVEWLGVSA